MIWKNKLFRQILYLRNVILKLRNTFCYRPILLFDFNNATNLRSWSDDSDSKESGRSESIFYLYKSRKKQVAVFYTHLRPLPLKKQSLLKPCYAGISVKTRLNLDGFRVIHFKCNPTGNATWYKVILRHDNLDDIDHMFEQSFKVCLILFYIYTK